MEQFIATALALGDDEAIRRRDRLHTCVQRALMYVIPSFLILGFVAGAIALGTHALSRAHTQAVVAFMCAVPVVAALTNHAGFCWDAAWLYRPLTAEYLQSKLEFLLQSTEAQSLYSAIFKSGRKLYWIDYFSMCSLFDRELALHKRSWHDPAFKWAVPASSEAANTAPRR